MELAIGQPATARIGYEAPSPGSEQIVHHHRHLRRRSSASPAVERTPLSLPIPLRPVASNAAPVLQPAAQAGKLEVNQK